MMEKSGDGTEQQLNREMRTLRKLKACIYLVRRAMRPQTLNPNTGVGMSTCTSEEHVNYLNARIEALEREVLRLNIKIKLTKK